MSKHAVLNAFKEMSIDQKNVFMDMINFYADQYKEGAKVDRLGALVGFFDAIDEEMSQEIAKSKTTPSCKKGCSFCCHLQVDISQVEAELILHYCQEKGIDIDQQYLKTQMAVQQINAWRSKENACVFLKDHLCTIYEVRPMSCRKYLVGTDPKLCDTSGNSTHQVGVLSSWNTEALAIAPVSAGEAIGLMAKMLLQQIEKNEKAKY